MVVEPSSDSLPSSAAPREEGGKVLPFPPRRRFATTRWSMVLAAGHSAAPEARKALEALCQQYWAPLHDFVQHKGFTKEQAADLTQSFFVRLLEKNALSVADPTRGRFRSWLLTSMTHFLANAWDAEQTRARGGGHVHVPLEDPEGRVIPAPSPDPTPDRVFEKRWAERLLEHVLAALREEYVLAGRGALFDHLKKTLTGDAGAAHAHIAEVLGMKPGAVKVAAFRFRKRYQELLLREVSHTVANPADAADELRFLITALAGP
ncbi:RNA polymerase sigma factor [Pyxidicoccus xibeiensis]|uniref:RNA polymerase sigma factor n=1 Tax=Pyxidicoccus xibeiensis TaxID=2906759 RepID=UPI0020A73727|nr:sigma-70 family RNA polymerase sigma factor [Pyxidicoccus xibeiensis]MCP3144681.1 sigma-70 family RNA polymerase sigma factor [Pyxidicoccus xibeiensis]